VIGALTSVIVCYHHRHLRPWLIVVVDRARVRLVPPLVVIARYPIGGYHRHDHDDPPRHDGRLPQGIVAMTAIGTMTIATTVIVARRHMNDGIIRLGVTIAIVVEALDAIALHDG